jgi:hypothetical protein
MLTRRSWLSRLLAAPAVLGLAPRTQAAAPEPLRIVLCQPSYAGDGKWYVLTERPILTLEDFFTVQNLMVIQVGRGAWRCQPINTDRSQNETVWWREVAAC